jgi:putative sterol carrier protein
MSAAEIIQSLPGRIKPGMLPAHNIIYHFIITGEEGGNFTLHLSAEQARVEPGLQGDPKCIVESRADDFENIVTGKLNPAMALMTGKVKVSNLNSMMKFLESIEKA